MGQLYQFYREDSWLRTTSLLVCVLGFKNTNVQKEAGKNFTCVNYLL